MDLIKIYTEIEFVLLAIFLLFLFFCPWININLQRNDYKMRTIINVPIFHILSSV